MGFAMDADDAQTPAGISWLCSLVADGTASREEGRLLIETFVRQSDFGSVSQELIAHVRDCFAAFLAGEKLLNPAPESGRATPLKVPIPTLDKAFGLVRATRGQPPVDRDTHCVVAMNVLRRLLQGETVEVATELIAADRKNRGLSISSDTQVADSWAAYKVDALIWLRLSRVVLDGKSRDWSPDEQARLSDIYANVPGVALPGETMFEGRHAIPDLSPGVFRE